MSQSTTDKIMQTARSIDDPKALDDFLKGAFNECFKQIGARDNQIEQLQGDVRRRDKLLAEKNKELDAAVHDLTALRGAWDDDRVVIEEVVIETIPLGDK